MNKAQLRVINGFMNLKDGEKTEVLKFLNDLTKKSLQEQLYEEEKLIDKLSKVVYTQSVCFVCGK